MSHERDLDIIEKYINGDLEQDEKSLVDRRLETDDSFQQTFLEYRDAILGVRQLFHNELKDTISQWSNELPRLEKEEKVADRSIGMRSWWWAAAAIFLISLVCAQIFTQFASVPAQQDLFAQHFEPYEDIISVRGQNSAEALLHSGMAYYSSEDYAKAAQQLEEYIQVNPDESSARLYLAISYLSLDQLVFAQQHFSNLISRQHPNFSQPAQWFLSLCFLKQGDEKEAISQLEKIKKQPQHPYQKDAVTLLKDLASS